MVMYFLNPSPLFNKILIQNPCYHFTVNNVIRCVTEKFFSLSIKNEKLPFTTDYYRKKREFVLHKLVFDDTNRHLLY